LKSFHANTPILTSEDYQSLLTAHDADINSLVEDIQRKDPPSFSYQIIESTNQKSMLLTLFLLLICVDIPIILLAYCISRVQSQRLKILFMTEVISHAFRDVLVERLKNDLITDPVQVTALYFKYLLKNELLLTSYSVILGRSDEIPRSTMEGILQTRCAPCITAEDIQRYLARSDSIIAVFFQVRGVIQIII
jgi:hypothetical protein